MSLTIGSLFSGIGGLDLGVERATGGRVVWQCEADPFRREILAKRWPDVRIFPIVEMLEPGEVDMICGGFPCRNISSAGPKTGISDTLWHEYARVVRDVTPRFVFVENVGALARRGLGRVEADLYELGYEVHSCTLSAWAVGAPHYSDRTFVLGRRSNEEGKPVQPVDDETPGLPKPGESFWETHPEPVRVASRAAGGLDRSKRLGAAGDCCPPQQAEAALRLLSGRLS